VQRTDSLLAGEGRDGLRDIAVVMLSGVSSSRPNLECNTLLAKKIGGSARCCVEYSSWLGGECVW